MNKFSQMKNLLALKKQADDMKKQMQSIKVEVEESGYKIVMLGDQTVESVTYEDENRNDLVKLFNKAVKESQKKSRRR
jgi:DNA-binding protein YbaB